jgi:large subunit ribosomal protein L35
MPKLKTHRGAAKRFKVTGSGKIRRHHANKSHILTKKKRKRKRHLRAGTLVDEADHAVIARLLPYLGASRARRNRRKSEDS